MKNLMLKVSNVWYISSPSSGKQQHEMPKFEVLWSDDKILILYLNLNTFLPIPFQDSSDTLYKLNELEWSRSWANYENIYFQGTFSLALTSVWLLLVPTIIQLTSGRASSQTLDNRPFLWWRHLTTTTGINFVFFSNSKFVIPVENKLNFLSSLT